MKEEEMENVSGCSNSNTWYEKGLSLSYLKRYQEAIKCYDNAIELDPKNVDAWYRKGYAFYENRQGR